MVKGDVVHHGYAVTVFKTTCASTWCTQQLNKSNRILEYSSHYCIYSLLYHLHTLFFSLIGIQVLGFLKTNNWAETVLLHLGHLFFHIWGQMTITHKQLNIVRCQHNQFFRRNTFKKCWATGGRVLITLKWLPDRMRRKELRKATTAQELKRLM